MSAAPSAAASSSDLVLPVSCAGSSLGAVVGAASSVSTSVSASMSSNSSKSAKIRSTSALDGVSRKVRSARVAAFHTALNISLRSSQNSGNLYLTRAANSSNFTMPSFDALVATSLKAAKTSGSKKGMLVLVALTRLSTSAAVPSSFESFSAFFASSALLASYLALRSAFAESMTWAGFATGATFSAGVAGFSSAAATGSAAAAG